MWIFDRTRTTYGESADHFIEAIKFRSADKVFEEVSRRLNVSLEAAKNSYATPIFHLGVGYKYDIAKLWLGKTELSPADIGTASTEFHFTDTAKLYMAGKIKRDTFLLMTIIRFQVLNSTLEVAKFQARIDNKVLPLLLTLQVLRELKNRSDQEAYITLNELGLLYEKKDHDNITCFVDDLLVRRASGVELPVVTGTDAFFKLFNYAGVVIDRTNIPLDNKRRRILVLAANRSMVSNSILRDPPHFIPISWGTRKKWAIEYISIPEHPERFLPPRNPFVLSIVLPQGCVFDRFNNTLSMPTIFGSSFQKQDLVTFENPLKGLKASIIYRIKDESFRLNNTVSLNLEVAFKSSDTALNISNIIKNR